MLQLTRSHPWLTVRAGVRLHASGNWRPRQLIIAFWRSACRHAERPDRVVPYYWFGTLKHWVIHALSARQHWTSSSVFFWVPANDRVAYQQLTDSGTMPNAINGLWLVLNWSAGELPAVKGSKCLEEPLARIFGLFALTDGSRPIGAVHGRPLSGCPVQR